MCSGSVYDWDTARWRAASTVCVRKFLWNSTSCHHVASFTSFRRETHTNKFTSQTIGYSLHYNFYSKFDSDTQWRIKIVCCFGWTTMKNFVTCTVLYTLLEQWNHAAILICSIFCALIWSIIYKLAIKWTPVFMMYCIHNVLTNMFQLLLWPSSVWCYYYNNTRYKCG